MSIDIVITTYRHRKVVLMEIVCSQEAPWNHSLAGQKKKLHNNTNCIQMMMMNFPAKIHYYMNHKVKSLNAFHCESMVLMADVRRSSGSTLLNTVPC